MDWVDWAQPAVCFFLGVTPPPSPANFSIFPTPKFRPFPPMFFNSRHFPQISPRIFPPTPTFPFYFRLGMCQHFSPRLRAISPKSFLGVTKSHRRRQSTQNPFSLLIRPSIPSEAPSKFESRPSAILLLRNMSSPIRNNFPSFSPLFMALALLLPSLLLLMDSTKAQQQSSAADLAAASALAQSLCRQFPGLDGCQQPMEKRKSAYMRFGKRKSAYMRFGKRSAAGMEEESLGMGEAEQPMEKRKSAYMRFGKRKSAYMRFGRK